MITYLDIPNNPHKFKQFYITLQGCFINNKNTPPFPPKNYLTIIHKNKYLKAGIHKDSVKEGNTNLYWNDDYIKNPTKFDIVEDNLFLLYDDTSDNYAHFWFDVFGQLCYYDILKKTNPKLKLCLRQEDYVEKGRYDYIKQVLDLCYPEETPFILKKDQFYKIKNLIIPNAFYWWPESTGHEPILDKIKQVISNIKPIPVSSNGCYISRQDTIKYGWTHNRILTNELELIDKIKNKLNYDIIELMDYDIIGKIQIFKSYKNIIQQNGASNVNIIFSSHKNTHILLGHPQHSGWTGAKVLQFCKYVNSNLILLNNIGREVKNECRANNPWELTNIDTLIEDLIKIDKKQH